MLGGDRALPPVDRALRFAALQQVAVDRGELPLPRPFTTALSPSQRARSIFSAIVGAEEELALAEALALDPGLGLAGAGVWPWGGESARITAATERMRRLAR
jgi:hypothetical protein